MPPPLNRRHCALVNKSPATHLNLEGGRSADEKVGVESSWHRNELRKEKEPKARGERVAPPVFSATWQFRLAEFLIP
jgi:hypothetical protein